MRRILLLALALLLCSAPAVAQSQPLTTGLNFSVGLSADPVPLRAGEVVTKSAQISNGSTAPESFNLSVISVDVGDEGVVTPAEQRSDAITKAVSLAPVVTVDPGATADVAITITAPENLDPDVYFVGILVQPANVVPNAGGQTTINRLLNVLAIDIFGAQSRGVEIGFPDHSRFHIGRIDDSYTVTNRNAGVSISRKVLLGGYLINSTELAADDSGRTSLDTIARGHKKTFKYSYQAGLLTFDIVRPTISVSFSDAGTQRTITKAGPETLLVSPLALGLVIGVVVFLLIVLVVFVVRRRRKRVARNGDDKGEDSTAPD